MEYSSSVVTFSDLANSPKKPGMRSAMDFRSSSSKRFLPTPCDICTSAPDTSAADAPMRDMVPAMASKITFASSVSIVVPRAAAAKRA